MNDIQMYELAEKYLVEGDAVFAEGEYGDEFKQKIINLASEMKQHEAEIAAEAQPEEAAE